MPEKSLGPGVRTSRAQGPERAQPGPFLQKKSREKNLYTVQAVYTLVDFFCLKRYFKILAEKIMTNFKLKFYIFLLFIQNGFL